MKPTEINTAKYLAAKDLAKGVFQLCRQMMKNERDVAGSEIYAAAIEVMSRIKNGEDYSEAFNRVECSVIVLKEMTKISEVRFNKVLRLMGELLKA